MRGLLTVSMLVATAASAEMVEGWTCSPTNRVPVANIRTDNERLGTIDLRHSSEGTERSSWNLYSSQVMIFIKAGEGTETWFQTGFMPLTESLTAIGSTLISTKDFSVEILPSDTDEHEGFVSLFMKDLHADLPTLAVRAAPVRCQKFFYSLPY